MIVVDSSVWIDYFSGADTPPQTEKLDNSLCTKPVAIGDLILTEVLQGFRHDKDYKVARKLFEDAAIFVAECKPFRTGSYHQSKPKKLAIGFPNQC